MDSLYHLNIYQTSNCSGLTKTEICFSHVKKETLNIHGNLVILLIVPVPRTSDTLTHSLVRYEHCLHIPGRKRAEYKIKDLKCVCSVR